MKHTLRFVLLAFLTSVAAACGPPPPPPKPILPQYMPHIHSARVVNFVPNSPNVVVGGSNNPGMLGLATDITTMGVVPEVREKLKNAISPQDLVGHMSTTFKDGLANTFAWDVHTDPKAQTDTRVEVTVHEYGLYADSPESQAYFMFIADTRVIFIPENRLIWASSEEHYAPVKDIHVGNTGAVGSAMTFAALLELPPERFREMMLTLSDEAGRTLINRMRADSVNY